ncbi:E4 SUMO-protein ligase PIAL1-like [Corylus avellana]|uniref:E4 SUMO-protein ligase PIAL1-like n=1 Tax=Corylus avellana TaxID=13451 RepID=UPI00286D1A90|nr:E4 SUMO-protein ligase PIAL1-like [Corylus avellana]
MGDIQELDELAELRGLDQEEKSRKADLLKDLENTLLCEEIYWRQKSRTLWLKEGDRNTRFFHKMANSYRRYNRVEVLRINGVLSDDPVMVKDHMVQYYQQLYSEQSSWRPRMDNQPFLSIDEEDYRSLVKSLNATFISLIPKKVDAVEMKDFRPISLVGGVYKIFSKVLAFRLRTVLGKVWFWGKVEGLDRMVYYVGKIFHSSEWLSGRVLEQFEGNSVIKAKYEDQEGGWCTKEVSGSHGVSVWKHIRQGWSSFAKGCRFEVGVGSKVRFWHDTWCGGTPLKQAFPSLFSIARHKEAWVKDNLTWRSGVIEWNVTFVRHVQDWEMELVAPFFERLYSCKISVGTVDRICWASSRKGNFEVNSLFKALSNFGHEMFPWKSIWRSKNACKIGWFLEKETEELFTLANEIWRSFSSPGDINTEPSNSLSAISIIMERFYPRMKMGNILASLEVKPGYGAYVIDIHILKNMPHSPKEKIWLFVAQTDNIETSACIISPPKVNFLLNGNPVDRRTNVLMETGPQFPTNVTPILKYGTNLLQAVGQFNGHYVIVVAFMSVISSSETPVLHDYVLPVVAAVDSDPDIVEGPSRISLHCPISYTRIKTPVKGHSCKHLQCFDFSNYLDINSRRPSWRCPHCNQYVCYLDICLDQNMAKVLREVGENVDEVIISADGSWKAIMGSDDHVDQAHDENAYCQKEKIEGLESSRVSTSLPNVLDLTEDNDEMEAMSSCETEDRKPFQASLPFATNLTLPPELNPTSGACRNIASQLEDAFWSGVYLNYGSMNASARSNAQRVGSISEPIHANLMQPPVLTDAVSPALNQEAEGRGNTNFTTPIMQSQNSPNNFQLRQSQYVNSVVNNEYERFSTISRPVSRTPIAVQALPAQSMAPNPQQRPRNNLNSLTPNGSSISSQVTRSVAPTTNAFNAICSDMERQQQLRAHEIPLQNQDHQDGLFMSAPSQLQGPYRPSPRRLTDFQISHLHQTFNPRMPQPVGQSSRPSTHLPQTHIQQGGTQVGISHAAGSTSNQQASSLAQRPAVQIGRQAPSMPVVNHTSRTGHSLAMNTDGIRDGMWEQRGNMGGASQAVPSADGLLDSTSEQNWRPSGRMRGSLSGQAYSAALSRFMIQPTETAQTARPPTNLAPVSSIPPQLQAFIANSRNAGSPQTPNTQ